MGGTAARVSYTVLSVQIRKAAWLHGPLYADLMLKYALAAARPCCRA